MSVAEIKTALAELSPAEQAEIVEYFGEIYRPVDTDVLAESVEEADRRMEEIRTGKVQTLSWDEFWVAVKRED